MQTRDKLIRQIQHHIDQLSENIGARPTGSVANQRAADYIAQIFAENGFHLELQKFDCIDWHAGETTLQMAGNELQIEPSPYSRSCDVQANVEVIETISQLEQADLAGKIALLRGELTTESLMPKNFRFYNPEHHQKLIGLLEAKLPVAIVTVSLHDTHLIPMIEDGDFEIPSAVISNHDADILVQNKLPIQLTIGNKREQSSGVNVIARKNQSCPDKFVITAHFDTKPGTPGALDNATGVTVLLTLAAMLKDRVPTDVGIELVAFNGEDYFSVPGQIAYLDAYGSNFEQINLAINCDGLGLSKSKTGISFLECPAQYVASIEAIIKQRFPTLEKLPPWYQGDHMLFAAVQTPTLAITSTEIFQLLDDVIHTKNDKLNLIDPTLIYEACMFIQEIVNLELINKSVESLPKRLD